MADLYSALYDVPVSDRPARRGIPVTPSDTLDVTNQAGDKAPCYAKALYVGVSGNVTVVHAADSTGTGVLYTGVAIGWFPVQVRRVMATGTTATNINGVYER